MAKLTPTDPETPTAPVPYDIDLHHIDVTDEVLAEMESNHEKWGEQNHPALTVTTVWAEEVHESYARQANAWKVANDAATRNGHLDWTGILLEEVFEALAESDPAARRAELIQVAAVALQEVASIDRAKATEVTEIPAIAATTTTEELAA